MMKNKFAWIVCLALAAALLFAPAALAADDGLFFSDQEATDSPAWVRIMPQALDPEVTQLFVVAGLGMDKTTATISMHERDESGAWKQVLSTPGFVGKYGLVPDAERVAGCGRTPAGTYHFNRAFGIAEDPGCAIEYVQADDNTWWSGDDREGMRYNEMVDIRDYPDLDRDESEHILDYLYQYQYCLNISFNEDGTPGRGSAIFLHCFGTVNPYTGGCVSVPENIMKQIMQRVQPDCVVVIDTLENLTGSEYPTDVFTVDYGASDIYTGTDMDAAVAAIWNEFKSWEGCRLHAVRYAGDENANEEKLAWLNKIAEANPAVFSGNYAECICFTTDFHTPAEESGDWAPDAEYTDCRWWLARTEGNDWEYVSMETAGAPVPAPTAAPAATATPVPQSVPVITKHPTGESLSAGGSCMFIARADNATGIVWRFVSPDGRTDEEYSSVYGYFPNLSMSGGTEETLWLSNIPYDLNGWRVYCRFSNNAGSVDTSSATITVAAVTPTPAPTATPAATPAPAVPAVTAAPAPEETYDDSSDYVDDSVDYGTDYSGYYTSGRAEMYVDGGPGTYYVTVNWPGSAFETATWTFSGTFDSDGTMHFTNCGKSIYTYYEDGTSDFINDYTDAGGTLSITGGGGLRLEIFGDWDISGTVFQ